MLRRGGLELGGLGGWRVWAEVAAYLYAATGTEANVVIIVMNDLSVD